MFEDWLVCWASAFSNYEGRLFFWWLSSGYTDSAVERMSASFCNCSLLKHVMRSSLALSYIFITFTFWLSVTWALPDSRYISKVGCACASTGPFGCFRRASLYFGQRLRTASGNPFYSQVSNTSGDTSFSCMDYLGTTVLKVHQARVGMCSQSWQTYLFYLYLFHFYFFSATFASTSIVPNQGGGGIMSLPIMVWRIDSRLLPTLVSKLGMVCVLWL